MRAFQHPGILVTCLLAAACGGGGRPTGPPVPVPDTIRTISGRVSYYTTGPDLSDVDPAGRLLPRVGFVTPTFPRAAPRVPVDVLSPSGTMLGQGLTDTNGDYAVQVNFGKNPATQVVVRIRAQLDLPFGTRVRVLPNVAAEPYSLQTPPSGDPDSKTMTIDLTVPRADGSAAFFILETLYPGFIAAKAGFTGSFPDLDVLWAPGNGSTSVLSAAPDKATLVVSGGIAGDPGSNTDAWDGPKLMRLLGEYLFAYFLVDIAPPGEVNGALVVPSAAWREGFLDFWSCIGRGSRIYWDTEGSGSEGRVVRYFDIESFFDPALGSLGPDDPNVYQDPALVGIGSACSVAELLWDIHDPEQGIFTGDEDGVEFPLFLTLRFLERFRLGQHYPYLFSLLDAYVGDGSLPSVTLDILMREPEMQGLEYPASDGTGLVWPMPIEDPAAPGDPLTIGFDGTVSDMVDTVTPDPVNLEIGFWTQRYFILDLAETATVSAGVTTAGDLRVEILALDNTLLAAGSPTAVAPALEPGRYIVRVKSNADPQLAPYDLRVQVD